MAVAHFGDWVYATSNPCKVFHKLLATCKRLIYNTEFAERCLTVKHRVVELFYNKSTKNHSVFNLPENLFVNMFARL